MPFSIIWNDCGAIIDDGYNQILVEWEFVELLGAKLIQEKAFYEAAKLERNKYGTNEDR